MKKNELISIVVPVYNVEKFLRKCIDSILEQSFNNLEIILVDDGSTDNSGKICDDYSCKDNRIKVVHKENGGLSDARNKGIDIANGKYIMFIDSDDWVSPKYVETFYNIMKNNDCNLVIGKLQSFNENQLINTYNENCTTVKKITKEEAYKSMFLEKDVAVSACAKMYDIGVFNELRYPCGELYEDFLVFDKIIENANNIVLTDYAGYYYLSRDGSIMRSSFDKKRLILIEKAQEYINLSKKKFPKLVEPAIKRYICCCFQIITLTIVNKNYDSISCDIRKKVLKYKKIVLYSSIFSIKEKFRVILLSIGIFPYRFFYKFYKNIKN